jgi:hypothetical protein
MDLGNVACRGFRIRKGEDIGGGDDEEDGQKFLDSDNTRLWLASVVKGREQWLSGHVVDGADCIPGSEKRDVMDVEVYPRGHSEAEEWSVWLYSICPDCTQLCCQDLDDDPSGIGAKKHIWFPSSEAERGSFFLLRNKKSHHYAHQFLELLINHRFLLASDQSSCS